MAIGYLMLNKPFYFLYSTLLKRKHRSFAFCCKFRYVSAIKGKSSQEASCRLFVTLVYVISEVFNL